MKLSFEKIFLDKKTLYIHGETGSGKTTMVKKLCSSYGIGKPVVVNLACLTEQLFESQLFGHKKGAFTGADKDFEGLLGQVKQGVLFLDEVSEISLSSQRKLLSLLEERVYYPVGASHPKRFSGHIITAGQPGLIEKVKKGEFRRDLYYRLCRFELYLKPLRSDKEGLRLALNNYRLKLNEELYEWLVNKYEWPGNYRELQNFLDFVDYTSTNKQIRLGDCPSWMQISEKSAESDLQSPLVSYAEAYEEFEKRFFSRAMHYYEGRVNYASHQLGVSKSTLIAKLKKYGISSLKIRAMSQEGAA